MAVVIPLGNQTVRFARLDEIDELVVLARLLHQESIMSYLPFSEEKVRRLAIDYISEPERHCVLAAEDNGKVIGIFVGQIIDYFFNDERLAISTFFYVRPEKRGFISLRLVRKFEEWARAHGAREIEFDMSSGVNADRSATLMERLGYRRVGHVLKMRVK